MNCNISEYERVHNVNQKSKQYDIDAYLKRVEIKTEEYPHYKFNTTKQEKYTVDSVFV